MSGTNTRGGAKKQEKAPEPPKSSGSPKPAKTGTGRGGQERATKDASQKDNKTDLHVQGQSAAATATPKPPLSDNSISNIIQALNLHPTSQDEAKQEYDRLVDEQRKFEVEFPDKFKEQCDHTETQRSELMNQSRTVKGNEVDSHLFRSLCAARQIKKDGAMGLSLDALIDFWLLNHNVENYRKLQPAPKHVTKVAVNQENEKTAGNDQRNKLPGKEAEQKIQTGDTTDGQAQDDKQPEAKRAKTDSHHDIRKADDRPKVIYKEVVVIPEGHMLVKVSDYHKLQIDLRNSNESVEELSSRLSAIASNKLKDGNPNIADLSDKNRPTKLGEQFGGLYDDEWSEAFEALTENDVMTDDQAIAFLMNILQQTYIFCMEVSSKQLTHMTKMFGNAIAKPFIPELGNENESSNEHAQKESGATSKTSSATSSTTTAPGNQKASGGSGPKTAGKPANAEEPASGSEDVNKDDFDDETRQIGQKFAKGLRKEGAINTLNGLKKTYYERVLGNILKLDMKKLHINVTKYADKCMSLLWLMCVQDPPMQIQWAIEKERVDVNNFKFYQSKGKWVKLSVWPAVFLCAGGAIVSKGYVVGGPQPEPEEAPETTDHPDSGPTQGETKKDAATNEEERKIDQESGSKSTKKEKLNEKKDGNTQGKTPKTKK